MELKLPQKKGPNRAEKMVMRYLDAIGLDWLFEASCKLLDDGGRPREWTPDIFIPALGFYVEVVGKSTRENYEYRRLVYTLNYLRVIFVYVERDDWRQQILDGIRKTGNEHYKLTKTTLANAKQV